MTLQRSRRPEIVFFAINNVKQLNIWEALNKPTFCGAPA
jgi:hypothetical protein